jgi:hypothetical protein
MHLMWEKPQAWKKHQNYYNCKGGKKEIYSLLPLGLALEWTSFGRTTQPKEEFRGALKKSCL